MDHKMRHSKKMAKEAVSQEVLEKIGVQFEYPEDEKLQKGAVNAEESEARLRKILRDLISMDDWDYMIFKQRVLFQLNVREIGKFPLFRGRMWVTSRCRYLSKKFPMFKSVLLRGFGDTTEPERTNHHGEEEREND